MRLGRSRRYPVSRHAPTVPGFTAPAVFAALLAMAAVSCSAPEPVSTTEVTVVTREALPASPDDPTWKGAPVHQAPLILQDMVEPRLLEPSTADVRVQALTDGTRIAFRLEWTDETKNDLPGSDRFADACAVQLPARIEADVPAPQMGEGGRPVEIAYWRASWQATVNGREDTIRSLYPAAAVDHYPFEAASLEPGSEDQLAMASRYSPARALGNAMEGPRVSAVEDLIAEGPGTLTPAPASVSTGAGSRTEHGWQVLIERPLPDGMRPGGHGEIAFAVWEGSNDEAGSRKMRTAWIPISVEGGS